MTIRLILAFAIAFFVASGVGAFLVPFLRKIKAGQAIREDGPRWHMSKSGTPTMGGLMFIAAIAVVCLTVGFEPMMNGDWGHIFCFVFALIFGAIGFLDDYEKLRKKQNLGLSAKAKFLLQLVAALAFVSSCAGRAMLRLTSTYPSGTWSSPCRKWCISSLPPSSSSAR